VAFNLGLTTALINTMAIAACILVFIRPRLGLSLMILLVPWEEYLASTPIPGVNVASALYLIPLFRALSVRRPLGVKPSLSVPLVLIVLNLLLSWVVTVVSGPVGYATWDVFFMIKRLVQAFSIYFTFLYLTEDEDDIKTFLLALLFGAGWQGFWILRGYLLGKRGRFAAPVGVNEGGAFFGAYWLFALPFLTSHITGDIGVQFLKIRSADFASAVFLTFCCLFGLAYCQSRGGYVAWLAACVAVAGLKYKKLLVVAVILAPLLLGQWTRFLPQVVVDRIKFTTEGAREGERFEGSAESRLVLWGAGLRMYGDNPIVGKGFGTFAHYSTQYADIRRPRVSHNHWVQVIAELGTIGALVFIWFTVAAFRSGFRLLRETEPASFFRDLSVVFVACWASLVVSNVFGNRFFNGSVTGYFLVTAALVDRARDIVLRRQSQPDTREEHEIP